MITLRTASIDDLAILNYWDEQEHVKASGEDEDWDWAVELPRSVDWREQFIAEQSGHPIGCIQIIDPAEEETHYWGEVAANKRAIDIWIGEVEDLGKGFGTEMMTLALDHCFEEEQVTEVLIDPLASNKKAIRFYQKLGFQFVEKKTFEEDECEIYVMSRKRWTNRSK